MYGYIKYMNYLATSNIQNIYPNIRLHPSSIVYIQTLLEPYAKIVDTAPSAESVLQWIPLALGKLIYPDKSVIVSLNELQTLKKGTATAAELLEEAKRATMNELLRVIIKSVNDEVLFYKGDDIILPWDIKESMSFSDYLLERFNVVKGDYKLPVVINNQFTYEMDEEMAMGLLLYCYIAQKPMQMTIFGIPLSTDYFAQPNRYTKFCSNKRRTEYSVLIGGQEYCFISREFMQGFVTGANWFQEDHRKYWSNLISYELNPAGVAVEF